MRFEQYKESGAQLPARATSKSAGYDLRALEGGCILPGNRKCISTGICWKDIPEHLWGEIKPRSGLAFNHGIDVLAGVIDADYKEEIKVILLNTNDFAFHYCAGERIAQLVIQKYYVMDKDTASALRTSGLGSTGNL